MKVITDQDYNNLIHKVLAKDRAGLIKTYNAMLPANKDEYKTHESEFYLRAIQPIHFQLGEAYGISQESPALGSFYTLLVHQFPNDFELYQMTFLSETNLESQLSAIILARTYYTYSDNSLEAHFPFLLFIAKHLTPKNFLDILNTIGQKNLISFWSHLRKNTYFIWSHTILSVFFEALISKNHIEAIPLLLNSYSEFSKITTEKKAYPLIDILTLPIYNNRSLFTLLSFKLHPESFKKFFHTLSPQEFSRFLKTIENSSNEIIIFSYVCYAGKQASSNLLPHFLGDDYLGKIAPYFIGKENEISSLIEHGLNEEKAIELSSKMRRINSLLKIYIYLLKRLTKHLGEPPIASEKVLNKQNDAWERIMDFFYLLRIIRDYPTETHFPIKAYLEHTKDKFTTGKITNTYSELREVLFYLTDDDFRQALISFETYQSMLSKRKLTPSISYETLQAMYTYHYSLEPSFQNRNPLLLSKPGEINTIRKPFEELITMVLEKQEQQFLQTVSNKTLSPELLADFSKEYHCLPGYEKVTLFGLVLEKFGIEAFMTLFQGCQPHIELYGENGLLGLYHITIPTLNGDEENHFNSLLSLIVKTFPADIFHNFTSIIPSNVSEKTKEDFLTKEILSVLEKMTNNNANIYYTYRERECSSCFQMRFWKNFLPILSPDMLNNIVSFDNTKAIFTNFTINIPLLKTFPNKKRSDEKLSTLFNALYGRKYGYTSFLKQTNITSLSFPTLIIATATEETVNKWLDLISNDAIKLEEFRQWALNGCQNFAEYADANYPNIHELQDTINDRRTCLLALAANHSFKTWNRFFSLLAQDGISFDKGLAPWGNLLRSDNYVMFNDTFYDVLEKNSLLHHTEKMMIADKLQTANLLPKLFHGLLSYNLYEKVIFKIDESYLSEKSSSYSNAAMCGLTFLLSVLHSFFTDSVSPDQIRKNFYLIPLLFDSITTIDPTMAEQIKNYFLTQYLPAFFNALIRPIEDEIDRADDAWNNEALSSTIFNQKRKLAIDFTQVILSEIKLMKLPSYQIDYSIVRRYFCKTPPELSSSLNKTPNLLIALYSEILDSLKRLEGKSAQKAFVSWWKDFLTVLQDPDYFDLYLPANSEKLARMQKVLSSIPREHLLAVSYIDTRRDTFKKLAHFCAEHTNSRELQDYLQFIRHRKLTPGIPHYEQKLLASVTLDAAVAEVNVSTARARI